MGHNMKTLLVFQTLDGRRDAELAAKFPSRRCNLQPEREIYHLTPAVPGVSKSHLSRVEGKGCLKYLWQERARGRRRPGEDRCLPGMEGRGQRSFSKGPQAPTRSMPPYSQPLGTHPVWCSWSAEAAQVIFKNYLYFFFLYKWIHSLLAATMCEFLNILVPLSSHKMKQSIQTVLVQIKRTNTCKALGTRLGTDLSGFISVH